MERTTCVAFEVVHDTPIVVGPEHGTVLGTLNELMVTALLEFEPELVINTMSRMMMMTMASTPAAMSHS